MINLEMKDDGTGGNSKTKSLYNGIGLTGMQERARMIGATLTINLSEQSGSTIRLEYYIQQNRT